MTVTWIGCLSVSWIFLLTEKKLESVIFQLNDAVFIKHFKMKQKIFLTDGH